jgi:hypothetical protein
LFTARRRPQPPTTHRETAPVLPLLQRPRDPSLRHQPRPVSRGTRGRLRWHRGRPIPQGTRDTPRRHRRRSTHDPSQPILGAWRAQPWMRRTACGTAAPPRRSGPPTRPGEGPGASTRAVRLQPSPPLMSVLLMAHQATRPRLLVPAGRPCSPARPGPPRLVGLLVVRIRLVGILLGRPGPPGLVGVRVVRVRSARSSLDPVGHRAPSSRTTAPGGSRPTPGLVGPAGPSLSI